jgi:magnesium transporter
MKIIGYDLEEQKFYSDIDAEFLKKNINDKSILFWVDVFQPNKENMDLVKNIFNFHPLALEDATSKSERPKMDEFENYLFLVLQIPLKAPINKRLETCIVSIFLGKNYVVTIHDFNFMPIKSIFNSYLSKKAIDCEDSAELMHKIIDALIDSCFPIVEDLNKTISIMEAKIFDVLDKKAFSEILILKRNILMFKNILRPEMNLLKSLERKDLKYISDDLEVFFGDILDHAEKIFDILEMTQELIESLYDSYQSLMSNKINEIMKLLTIISVIMMPLTLISGIYGMNVRLPLSDSSNAFIIIVATMLLIVLLMLVYFRKKDWF